MVALGSRHTSLAALCLIPLLLTPAILTGCSEQNGNPPASVAAPAPVASSPSQETPARTKLAMDPVSALPVPGVTPPAAKAADAGAPVSGVTAERPVPGSDFGMAEIPGLPAPVKFSFKVVLEIPFGAGEGQVGFANGVDHTPFPESVQAFKVKGNELALADTFNGRIQIWDTDSGKCLGTITPATDAEGSFYCGIDWLDNGFVLSDALNSTVIAVGSTGEIAALTGTGFPIDHITTVTATPGGLVFLGDKGPAVDKVRVVSRGAGLVADIPVPGLTEAGFALDPAGRVLAARERTGAEHPLLDIFGATDEANESMAFAPLGSMELKNSTLPPGRFNVAGIDGSGRIFLYWAGLPEYFGPAAAQFPDEIKALPATHMVARFNVFEPDGKLAADFFAPVSTAPETAVVTPEGDLFVLAYDAGPAPEGKVRFIRFSAK